MKSFAKWLLVAVLPISIAVAETSVEDFVKLPSFGVVAMSPDGKHLAATTDVKGDAAMIVMNIENPKKPDVILRKRAAKGQSIASIGWVSDERRLFTTTERNGTLARPIGGGVVYAVDYNGKNEFRLGSGR